MSRGEVLPLYRIFAGYNSLQHKELVHIVHWSWTGGLWEGIWEKQD